MPKQLSFHSPFTRVMVVCNGVPLSLNAEVAITLSRPAKLDRASRAAWEQLSPKSAQAVTAELIEGGSDEE